MNRYLLATFFALAVPAAAQASVRINEIAWMGTPDSANAEWIELANDSDSSVDISGWTLTSSDGSPSITFPSGSTIAGKGYFLLERTRKTNIPGVAADLVYTGSLSNKGETLTLTNAASTTVDTVEGGDGWCLVGGNNATKETAQWTPSGWITATATPRRANLQTGTAPSCALGTAPSSGDTSASSSPPATTSPREETGTTSPPASAGGRGGGGPPTYAPIPVVFLDIGPDRQIVAGADVKFQARVFNEKGKPYPDAIVHWAFGDGSSADSASVFKSYWAPGTYAVTATAIEGMGSGEDSMVVTVKDALVRVQSISPHGITLANDAGDTLDLSLWRLQVGTTTYQLPQGTKILPHRTVLFPKEVTGLAGAPDAALLYPNGNTAAAYGVVKSVTAEPPAHTVQPAARREGFNPIQVGAPASDTSANTKHTYENTAVIAPATSSGNTFPSNPRPSSSTPSPFSSFFTSPLTLSLLGVLATSGTLFLLL